MNDIHPEPTEFTAGEIHSDHILRCFHYSHLPDALKARSKPFCDLSPKMRAALGMKKLDG